MKNHPEAIFQKPKEPHQVQCDQKKQSLRCQASTCPRYKSFRLCSHTVAIAFKLNIFAPYISRKRKEENRITHSQMLLISENKMMQVKKTSKRKRAANNKSEKVIKLIDPDNENISFSNNNVGLVTSDIATRKPSYPNPLPNQ